MAGIKLDGAGTAKMATLDEALLELQRLHGVVELMALQVKSNKPTAQFQQQIRRIGTNMAGKLKGQFGMISDQITALMLASSRGSGEQQKVRALREGVAQVRTALEIAVAQTKEKHEVRHEKPTADAG